MSTAVLAFLFVAITFFSVSLAATVWSVGTDIARLLRERRERRLP